MRHLSDDEIQDYLDGNLAENDAEIKEYLQKSEKSRTELARYKTLYNKLAEETDFELSPNFASNVVALTEEQSAEKFFHRISQIVLWAVGIVIGIAAVIRFTDIENYFKGFKEVGVQGEGIFNTIANSFQSLFANSSLNFSLIGAVAFVLLAIFLIDRLIMRARKNITSASLI